MQMYLNINLILTLAFILAFIFSKTTKAHTKARARVLTHYGLITVSILLPFSISLWPSPSFDLPLPQVFDPVLSATSTPFIATSLTQAQSLVSSSLPSSLFLNIVIFVSVLAFLFLGRAIQQTLGQIHKAPRLRKIGSVEVRIAPGNTTPYAFSLFKKSFVVVPEAMLMSPLDLKIALKHELQHLRHADTAATLLLEILRCLFYLNPFFHLWIQLIHQEQEIACDAALLQSHRVTRRDYAHCLWQVTQSLHRDTGVPFGATAFLLKSSQSSLLERLTLMKTKHSSQKSVLAMVLFLTLALPGLSLAATALSSLKLSSPLTLAQVQTLFDKMDLSFDFAFEVTPEVVEQVNRLVTTKSGQTFVQKSLKNSERYQQELSAALRKQGLPQELLAIPFVESGYQNLESHHNPVKAAGLWQFIPQTARRYGLRVDESQDDRLNVSLETQAALQYLQEMYQIFGDWNLAIMAYNAGQGAVQRGLKQTKSRSAWDLIRAGHENDKGYLAKVLAAVLVMGNPELVED